MNKNLENTDIKQYDKIYCIDTNIILNDVNNIELLSQNSNNLIIIPETVLDEVDTKKSGFDEINFQAREFARGTIDEEIIRVFKVNYLTVVETKLGNSTIFTVSKEKYNADSDSVPNSIKNDRKILEITSDLVKNNHYLSNIDLSELVFVSLDGMARKRAVSMGLKTETLNISDELFEAYNTNFFKQLKIESYNGDTSKLPKFENHISNIEIIDTNSGKKYFYYLSGNNWELIDDKNIDRLPTVPRNKGQKALSKIILDDINDIIVINGAAGTGKTYIALGTATRLMDLHKDKYTNILYIRKTVISGNKDDELGFMPGTLTEKISGYTAPIEDSILSIIMNKYKKKMTKDEINLKCEEFKDKYQINYGYMGHLRGSTFAKGTIVILDEFQNFDYSSAKTILSRVGEDNKVIIMGSNAQIDTAYLSKHNNALTFMMSQCGINNSSDIIIKGINLTNVIRSKVSEWTDLAFEKLT